MLNFLKYLFQAETARFCSLNPKFWGKIKLPSLVEMGSVCCFFFFFVVVGEQLPGALPPPTDLEYVPLDTSSGLKHWITLDCCCILMIWQWWKLLLFFQAVNKKRGKKLAFFFSSGFPKLPAAQHFHRS